MIPNTCENCKRTLDQIKAQNHAKHEWLYTDHESHKILCADCTIELNNKRGVSLPDTKLSSINQNRSKES